MALNLALPESVSSLVHRFRIANAKSALGIEERLLIYDTMRFYSEDRRPPRDALEDMLDDARRRGSQAKIAYATWIRGIDDGLPLAEVMHGWVPDNEAVFFRVAESGGDLTGALTELIAMLEMRRDARSAFTSAMVSPAIRVFILIALLYFFGLFFVPTVLSSLKTIYPTDQWNPAARAVLLSVMWFGHWGGYFIALAVGTIVGLWIALPRYKGVWRRFLDSLPVYSLYRQYTACYFLIAVAAMERSGIPLYEAIDAMAHGAKPWPLSHYRRMRRIAEEGQPASEVVDTGLMPDYIRDRAVRYATSAEYGRAFRRVGMQSLKRMIAAVKRNAQFLDTASMVALAFSLIAIMGSFLMVVFQMRAYVQGHFSGH